MEVPASTADQATASLLQNLNTSREVEQVSTASQPLSATLCKYQLHCKQHVRVRLHLCIDAEVCTVTQKAIRFYAMPNCVIADHSEFDGMCAYSRQV